MLPDTATRVQSHTARRVNERIWHETNDRLCAFRAEDKRVLIDRRLAELDREWDVERALQTNFAIASLTGLGLASRVGGGWFGLALGVPAFMLLHALQGWCPPLPVLRRLGFRTSKEINEERFALKSLRGDFTGLERSPEAIVAAVKK